MTTTKSVRAPRPDATIHSAEATVIGELGDIVHTPESPILTPPNGHEQVDQGGRVVYDHTEASIPSGSRCILIINAPGAMTAREAIRVGTQLIETAKVAADERELRGFHD